MAENICNAVIDISKILVASSDTEMPYSYQDIILALVLIKVLDEPVAQKIAKYAALRNILAHQYLDMKWDKIKNFIIDAPHLIPEFIQAVSKFGSQNV